ncbi:hypothetical protein [Variovorax davisae]|uniref:hypothetical protein n=1 Tax=Variovorax davisae TaxID=3053515 RepID=UPI004038037F
MNARVILRFDMLGQHCCFNRASGAVMLTRAVADRSGLGDMRARLDELAAVTRQSVAENHAGWFDRLSAYLLAERLRRRILSVELAQARNTVLAPRDALDIQRMYEVLRAVAAEAARDQLPRRNIRAHLRALIEVERRLWRPLSFRFGP